MASASLANGRVGTRGCGHLSVAGVHDGQYNAASEDILGYSERDNGWFRESAKCGLLPQKLERGRLNNRRCWARLDQQRSKPLTIESNDVVEEPKSRGGGNETLQSE